MRKRIAVLGGGISGLAATYRLARAREAGAAIEEFVIEGSDRLGGLIRTERVGEFVLEAGPDSFLTEKPEAAALCGQLGLGDSLLGSNDDLRRTYILHRSRLVPLPEGLRLFIPAQLGPALKTSLLSWSSKLAILVERLGYFERRDNSSSTDESIASFVQRHFGASMVENIADPLLAGVFGGDSKALSVRSALPRFWEMERQYGSLTRAIRRQDPQGRRARAHRTPPPLFTTLKNGLEQLVDELKNQLAGSGVCLRQRVTSIEPSRLNAKAGPKATPGFTIRCNGGRAIEADAIIFALPAQEAGRLISTFDPELAGSLGAIPYAPALTVALAYDGCGALPPGFGFLVPRTENRRLLACTFVHHKFAYRAPPGKALLRCFLSGSRDPAIMNLEDGEVISIVRRELAEILHLSREPLFHRIYRWPSSLPQYVVGHQEVVSAVQAQLGRHRGLFLAGNAYSGIGLSDCVRAGTEAAERALEPEL